MNTLQKQFFNSAIKTSLIFCFLLPYLMSFSPNPADSSSTTVQFAVGKGSYAIVSRDCSGRVTGVEDVPYTDAGISVDHNVSSVRFGAKAGVYSPTETNSENIVKYINPNIGINTDYVGLDAGAIFLNQDDPFGNRHRSSYYYYDSLRINRLTVYPTGSLRVGYLDSWYFTTSIYNNLPIVTGGGIFDLGVGFNTGEDLRSQLWFGFGVIPFDRPIFSAKGDFPLFDNLILNLRGGFNSGDATEYGLSLGTKIIF